MRCTEFLAPTALDPLRPRLHPRGCRSVDRYPFSGLLRLQVGTQKQASRETARLAELLKIEAQRPDPDGGPARADEPTSGTAANT